MKNQEKISDEKEIETPSKVNLSRKLKLAFVPIFVIPFFVSEFLKLGMYLEFLILQCFVKGSTFQDVVLFGFMYEHDNMYILPLLYLIIYVCTIAIAFMLRKDFSTKKSFWLMISNLVLCFSPYIIAAISLEAYLPMLIFNLIEVVVFIMIIVAIIKAYKTLIKK